VTVTPPDLDTPSGPPQFVTFARLLGLGYRALVETLTLQIPTFYWPNVMISTERHGTHVRSICRALTELFVRWCSVPSRSMRLPSDHVLERHKLERSRPALFLRESPMLHFYVLHSRPRRNSGSAFHASFSKFVASQKQLRFFCSVALLNPLIRLGQAVLANGSS
jgi:hypothetical protein